MIGSGNSAGYSTGPSVRNNVTGFAVPAAAAAATATATTATCSPFASRPDAAATTGGGGGSGGGVWCPSSA